MDYLFFAEQLLFSGLLGLLVGVEREFDRERKKGIPMGARTFIFISVIGFISSFAGIVIPAFIGVITLSVISFIARFKEYGERGLTTYFAALMVFLSGVIISSGEFIIGASVSIVTAGVLSVSPGIHRFTQLLTRKELQSTILFAVISAVILPLLPDKSFGLFNPFRFWLIVVIISGLSFASYIALRLFSDGLALSAFIGGFISSKLVILSFKEFESREAFNASILATASSLLMNFLVFSLIIHDLSLIIKLLIPLFFFSALIIALFVKKDRNYKHPAFKPVNPFTLSSALKLGFIIFIIMELASIISTSYQGLFIVTFFSSIVSSVGTIASISSLILNNLINGLTAVKLVIFSSGIIVLINLIISYFLNAKLFKRLLKPLLIWACLIFSYLIIL